MKNIIFLTFFIISLGFVSSNKNNSQFSIKKENVTHFNILLEDMCVSHMNKIHKNNLPWKCLLRNSLKQESKIIKLLDPENKNIRIDCICSLSYECFDYEEFELDNELVSVNDYMKKENFQGNNVYTVVSSKTPQIIITTTTITTNKHF